MAAEADKVVVELIAENAQFEQAVRQSASTFDQSMSRIAASAANAEAAVSRGFTRQERELARIAGPAAEAELRHRRLAAAIIGTAEASGTAETSHKRLTASMGNSRIAMLEFQHIARASADQIAAGAPLTQVLTQHMAQLAQATGFASGSLGTLGRFLGNPYVQAAVLAGTAIAALVLRHKEEGDTVDSLLKKLQEHHDKAVANAEANDIWKHSIDGVIESEKSLADQLDKSLVVQSVAQRQAVANAQSLVALRALQVAKAEDKYGVGDSRALKAQEAFHQAVRILHDDLLKFGEQEGAALAGLTERSQQWADKQTVIVRSLQTMHPELTQFGGDINAAFALMKKAVADAAGADVPFDDVTRQVDALNNKLAQSPGGVREYVAELRKLAAQLEAAAEAAKKLGKIDPIAQFKGAVIGAEGTGANRLGSSAAGFGQFMPSTWEAYFKQLFPQVAAGLSKAGIDDLRNNKEVAVAVIDAATKDYVAVLQRAGQQISAAGLYTVHLLGNRDATRLLNAPGGQSTSDFLSAGVLRGNPFLRGTAADARSAIAGRIGDSSSAVSQGAIALQRELDSLQQHESDRLHKDLNTEQEVTVAKGEQRDLLNEMLGGNLTLAELMRSDILPSLKAWEEQYEQIKDSQQELNRFGGQLIDDVLNPDNWTSWGDMGKRILRELEMEFIQLAAINPLKNLLFGSKLPTLLSGLTGLFGGGGGLDVGSIIAGGTGSLGPIASLPTASLPHFAGGGGFRIGGAGGDTHVLSLDGVAQAMVGGGETVGVIPNNAKAIAPGSSAPPGYVYVRVEPSPYFDGRVMEVSGPVIARAAVGAANGGATIGRRNLARESQHRLE